MSRYTVQKQVRQRDRFLCAHCRKRGGERYAHIIPNGEGGSYSIDNLNFLCAECDNQLEAARAGEELKQALVGVMKNIHDTPKQDGLLHQIFTFPADKKIIVLLGGGFRFVNHANILESLANPNKPYLKLEIDKLRLLKISAYFEDENGAVFMEIKDNIMALNTKSAWDLTVQRRSIKFQHIDKKITLKVRQSKNCDLHVTGSIYLNGGFYHISAQRIHEAATNNTLEECGKKFIGKGLSEGKGLMLSPTLLAF